MREKLQKQYENYEDSFFFIECAFEGLLKANTKEKQIVFFIHNHFKQNDKCDFIQMKKCAKHWGNVAFDKLNNHDFLNYKSCVFAISNYRIICKEMESLIDSVENSLED